MQSYLILQHIIFLVPLQDGRHFFQSRILLHNVELTNPNQVPQSQHREFGNAILVAGQEVSRLTDTIARMTARSKQRKNDRKNLSCQLFARRVIPPTHEIPNARSETIISTRNTIDKAQLVYVKMVTRSQKLFQLTAYSRAQTRVLDLPRKCRHAAGQDT